MYKSSAAGPLHAISAPLANLTFVVFAVILEDIIVMLLYFIVCKNLLRKFYTFDI